MRPEGLHRGTRRVRHLTGCAEAEQHLRARSPRPAILRITAVCFLRETAHGTEVLAVRKRGTGTYMQVGGKLEPGESALEAAVREVEEELGVQLAREDLSLLGDFEASAANEPNTLVRSMVWTTHAPCPRTSSCAPSSPITAGSISMLRDRHTARSADGPAHPAGAAHPLSAGPDGRRRAPVGARRRRRSGTVSLRRCGPSRSSVRGPRCRERRGSRTP